MPNECPTCGLELDGAKHNCSFRALGWAAIELITINNDLIRLAKRLTAIEKRVSQ